MPSIVIAAMPRLAALVKTYFNSPPIKAQRISAPGASVKVMVCLNACSNLSLLSQSPRSRIAGSKSS
jgi:hypothetical protein